MAKYTPGSLTGDLAPVQPELEKIASAIDDQMDRVPDPSPSNAMTADLDMNGKSILNVKNISSDGSVPVAVGDDVSLLNNDVPYLKNGDNVSELANDSNYLASGDNVSELVNDAGYSTGVDYTWYDVTPNNGGGVDVLGFLNNVAANNGVSQTFFTVDDQFATGIKEVIIRSNLGTITLAESASPNGFRTRNGVSVIIAVGQAVRFVKGPTDADGWMELQ